MNSPAANYRLFVRSFLAFFFLFPLALGTFNFCLDPNHRYHFSVREPILRELASSDEKLLLVPKNYDDRIFLKKYLRVSSVPSVAVLGGSRVANIQAEAFGRQGSTEFLNASVTAGTIRDYIAVWQMIKELHLKPKVVFIGIDEQSISGTSQNNRYLSLLEYYEAFFEKGVSLRVRWMGLTTDLKDLLSLQTTSASLKLLLGGREEISRLVNRREYDGTTAARTSSLALLYPKDYQSRPAEVIALEANANGRGEVSVFEKWNPRDRRGYDQLQALLHDIKTEGVKAVLVMMPYHPEALKMIQGSPRAHESFKSFTVELEKMSVEEGAYFYNEIPGKTSHFLAGDFLDGVHLRAAPNNRFFRAAGEAADIGGL